MNIILTKGAPFFAPCPQDEPEDDIPDTVFDNEPDTDIDVFQEFVARGVCAPTWVNAF